MDSKPIFPFRKTLFEKILPSTITCCVDLYVQLQLDATPTITTTFDLWMSKGQCHYGCGVGKIIESNVGEIWAHI
jgi:hypothetical protein